MIKLNFYFELDERLEIAVDEDGNFGKAYVCCSMEVEKEPTANQTQKIESIYRKLVAKQINGFIDFITPITQEEYKQNVDED
ncbi:hypothetical protein CLPUN_09470 [Clostridium puniceum]|uniref:Uncharacterized protein n=1 Tax=Clostridium puniceum TaxID=29367 RepID=A0A1S8TVD5_9CLOT|nr:hypothetical protein [Clostridium puniceum]OOM81763.1 hypothetical protein CLPUN_09470 [Clostridium puniceum]